MRDFDIRNSLLSFASGKNALYHKHIVQRPSASAQDECNRSLGSLYRENFWN